MAKSEEKEEKDKKEGSISKVKSFFGFGKKKKEEELLLDIEDKAEKIEVERKISNQIWQDIEKEKKNIEENEQKEKSILSFFKTSFSQEKFEELWPELEMGLLQSNIAYKVVDEIKNQLQCKLVNQKVSEKDVHGIFKNIISELLMEPPNIIKEIKSKIKEKKPFVIIFVGINGSGKTTNMAKFAHLLKKENISCCMAAADTFRSAAIEQLQTHSETLNVPFIKKDYGSDPASVGFDAITYAKKHALDVVLIDTAGRMQTKDSLMKEMEKIVRVCNPDMKIFVGESITGNDATEQAQAFNEAINLDGIILSKADVDEKGGTAISVSFITKKPILFLGTGQKYDDLEIFSKEKILKSLGL